jgi:predicted CoA-binding protein
MASITGMSPQGFFDDVKSIAVVGVSERPAKFGASAYRELKKRGFAVYPLHPSLKTFDGDPCYCSPADLPSVPGCALVTVKPKDATEVVRQLSARGVKRIWFQQGSDFTSVADEAEKLGMKTVRGRCNLKSRHHLNS